MTKPTVFLSHSKKDKSLIERIANDLQSCRINAWYDDWEIPTGVSFRRKIFEEGIPNCDCFFVYLTLSSINSYWVQKELDAAFIEESRNKKARILTFVESTETLNGLPSHLASLNSPILNDKEYENGFRKLITAVFETKISINEKERSIESENAKLRLEKEIAELKSQIVSLTAKGRTSHEKLYQELSKIIFSVEANVISALDLLKVIYPSLSDGASSFLLAEKIRSHWSLQNKEGPYGQLEFGNGFRVSDFLAPLIIRSIIDILRPADGSGQYYYLGEIGKEFCLFIENLKTE